MDREPEGLGNMLHTFDATKMIAFPIGQAVGNVNHGPRLIESVAME